MRTEQNRKKQMRQVKASNKNNCQSSDNGVAMKAIGLPSAILVLGVFGADNHSSDNDSLFFFRSADYGLTELLQNFQDNWITPMLIFISVGFAIFMLQSVVFSKPKPITSREKPKSLENPETQPVYEEPAEIEHTPEQMKGIRERHNVSSKTIASYSMDTMLALNYPAFNDVTEDATSNMLKASQYAGDMYDLAKANPTTENIKNYSEAVTDLENKVQLAKENAEQVQWDRLDSTLKRYFRKAEGLYNHAFNEGNPEELRISYLNELKSVIEDINKHSRRSTIPKDILIGIEKRSQLEITG